MKEKLNRFWTWYDKIQEPWRFFFAIFVLCLPMHIGSLTGHFAIGACFMLPILFSKMVSNYLTSKKQTN